MHTTCMYTVHASVASHQMSVTEGDLQVKKFEKVSTFGHQISLAGAWGQWSL